MTKKLYDTDSHQFTFDAVVTACEPYRDRFAITLDQTAFFPEGGGQYADAGTLNEITVLDVQEVHGEILHYTDTPIAVGTAVHGVLNGEKRFSRMQNHSGEHIVSGIVHRLFGYDNVGFHLSDDDMTVDYNGTLTREDLDRVESLANEAVAQNLEIIAEYPDPALLAAMQYRSKLELTENVRIVTIGEVDCCACCAPHVSRTGEIGLIKILDFEHYKGGVRCHILCGFRAMADYRVKYANVQDISLLLCIPQSETAQAVRRLLDDMKQKEYSLVGLRRKLAEAALDSALQSQHCMCFFADASCDADSLRHAVNLGMQQKAVCAGFLPTEGGWRYCIGSGSVDLRANAREINAALQGRGGGQSGMIQGTASASQDEIADYFEKFAL